MSSSGSDREPLEKLAEEFAERYRRGERPSLTEYIARYPALSQEIRALFPALVLMEEFGSVAGASTGPDLSTVAEEARRPQQLGEYRILREVGRGGMGVVYEAVQESLGRHVALKVLPLSGLLNASHLERFRREARAAARLHHSNIVPVFGVGEHEGIHYYAMQFIQGQGLDAVLAELKQMRGSAGFSGKALPATGKGLRASIAEGLLSGCFPSGIPAPSEPASDKTTQIGEQPGTAIPGGPPSLAGQSESQFYRSVARVCVQVAEALAYAHQQGVLHRDVKPSNLLLDTHGTVWVTDFGLAKAEGSEELTSPGDIVGTIRYMAPERFQGHNDPRSDVYGLGMTLYELLTLSPAFEDTNRARLIQRVSHEEPPRPRQRDPHLPRDLETIVLKAIAKEPAERYPSAEALADDLRRFLADRPIQARRSSGVERAWRWCRRNPVVAGLIAAVAVSSLLGTVVSIDFALDAREQARQQALARADAERQRQDAITHLYRSLVGEIRALRLARESGYRVKVWERLKQARRLETPERNLEELRAEAVACMGDFVGREPTVWQEPGIGRAGGQRLAFHPDGTLLALGLMDGTVLLANPDTGHKVPLRGHRADISAIAFAADGKKLVSGDVQNTINVWEPTSAGQWTRARALPTAGLFQRAGQELALAISPDGRLAAACPADAAKLAVWDLGNGTLVAQLRGPRDEVLRSPSWSPDGKWLAAGYKLVSRGEHGVLVWNVADRQGVCHPFDEDFNPGSAFRVVFSPDGRYLATGGNEGFGILEARSLPELRRLHRVRGDLVRAVAFSPDSRQLFLTSEALGVVRIWDLASNRLVAALQHPGRGNGLALSPDGRTLAVLSRQCVQFWNLVAPEEKLVLPGHTGGVPGLAFSPDGTWLASAGKDRTARLWNLRAGEKRELGLAGKGQAVAFSPDARTLATADWAGEVRLWDVPATRNYQLVKDHGLGSHLWSVAFSPDGSWFAAGGSGGLRVWRVQGLGAPSTGPGLPLQELPLIRDRETVTWCCFSPDSRQLAWTSERKGSPGCPISFCDLPDVRPRLLPTRTDGFVLPLAFSRQNGLLLFASHRQEVEAWDVSLGQKRDSFGRRELVNGNGMIALSPDGAWLASWGNQVITIWDTQSHKPLLSLPQEQSTAWALAWSLDRERLAVSSSDGGPVIWNIGTIREQLRELGLNW